MGSSADKRHRVTIRATADELRSGTFAMPDGEISESVVEFAFWVEVEGQAIQIRTAASTEFVNAVPDWKRYVGKNVLTSVYNHLVADSAK